MCRITMLLLHLCAWPVVLIGISPLEVAADPLTGSRALAYRQTPVCNLWLQHEQAGWRGLIQSNTQIWFPHICILMRKKKRGVFLAAGKTGDGQNLEIWVFTALVWWAEVSGRARMYLHVFTCKWHDILVALPRALLPPLFDYHRLLVCYIPLSLFSSGSGSWCVSPCDPLTEKITKTRTSTTSQLIWSQQLTPNYWLMLNEAAFTSYNQRHDAAAPII